MQTADAGAIDAQGRLAIPPFVEPHIHLDATPPRVSRSGTAAALFEGITAGASAKRVLPRRTPAGAETIGMRRFRVQHVRTMWMSPTVAGTAGAAGGET